MTSDEAQVVKLIGYLQAQTFMRGHVLRHRCVWPHGKPVVVTRSWVDVTAKLRAYKACHRPLEIILCQVWDCLSPSKSSTFQMLNHGGAHCVTCHECMVATRSFLEVACLGRGGVSNAVLLYRGAACVSSTCCRSSCLMMINVSS